MKKTATNQLLMLSAIALTSLVGSMPSMSATIIVDDHFNGPAGDPPNPAYWAVSSASVVLDGLGSVTLPRPPFEYQYVEGIASLGYLPIGENRVVATFGDLTGEPYNASVGLTGSPGMAGQRILLRNDLGNGFWNIDINDGINAFTYRPLAVGSTTLGTWTIDWSSDRVQVLHDGMLRFDSSVNLPTVGDAAWSFPTVALKPGVGQYGSAALNVGSIKYETNPVPEPGTAALLILGLGVIGHYYRKTSRHPAE